MIKIYKSHSRFSKNLNALAEWSHVNTMTSRPDCNNEGAVNGVVP